MGAFCLHRCDANIDSVCVSRVFKEKGFSAPNILCMGEWRLILYKKQLLNIQNFHRDSNGNVVCAVGTPIYKGRAHQDSLQELLNDYLCNDIEFDQLIGSFCVIFWNGVNIKLLTDRTNTFHVFYREQGDCISSSFLAIVASATKRLHLNRLAAGERLCAGYITSPDTLVDGIFCYDGDASKICWKRGLSWMTNQKMKGVLPCHRTRLSAINAQIEALKEHFDEIRPISGEFGIHVGFSDGLDSRLLLACAINMKLPIQLYTHATAGGHELSGRRVREIAAAEDFPLIQVPTRRVLDCDPLGIASILKNNLYYCDGRNGDTLGGFNPTYTADYQRAVVGSRLFGLNGIGGEIYRNYRFASRKALPILKWMDVEVFSRFSRETIGGTYDVNEIKERMYSKIVKRIGYPDKKGMADLLWQHRYFGLVNMPDSRAIINDAHNQMHFFHTPFLDYTLVNTALSAVPFMGNSVEFESDLICQLNSRLASYSSSYGYSFDSIPPMTRMSDWLKCHCPDYARFLWHGIREWWSYDKIIGLYKSAVDNCSCIRDDKEILLSNGLVRNFELAMCDDRQRPSVIMVAELLREFSDKIEV